MSSAADARAKERNRVKSGSMNGLGRLLIYRDKAQKPEGRPDDEATHWSQVNMKSLEHVPPGVEAGLRMTKAMRKSRVLLKEKGFVPMKAFVFCRVEEGVTTEDLHRVFTHQIGQSFVDLLHGKEDNSRNRSRAYCELVRIYPEGLFKGFSYPNLAKKEDYTLQVLSGKCGEAACISVAESENANSDEEELDLGSEAESENDSVPVAESQSMSLIPATPPLATGVNPQGNLESTPRKKKSDTSSGAPDKAAPPTTSTVILGTNASLSQDFPTDPSQIPGPSSQTLASAACTPSKEKNSDSRPALRLNTPVPPAVAAAVARIYGVNSPPKERAKKPHPTTQQLMEDPFIGVKPGFPMQGRKTIAAKRSLNRPLAASKKDANNNRKGKKRGPTMTEEDGVNMLVSLDDVGNSSDEFVQEEDSDSEMPKKGKRSAMTMDDMGPARKSKHRCSDDCDCVQLDRGTLRKRLSTNPEGHMRENLRYLDFRQILKGFTDMRHHLNRVEQKLDAISSGNTAVAELAEKVVDAKETEAALADERGKIGAPWGSIEAIEEALEDPVKEQFAYRLLKTVSQDQTHFPREATRLLLRSHLRHRVYMKRPTKNPDVIIRYGQEYVVYPPCFNELMVNYMSEQVVGLKGVPKADAKWQAHFNDTRKTAKKEMEALFKRKENRNNELYALCYRDTKAKLYKITEPAPLKPPREKEKLPEYEEKKAKFIERWKPIVDAAYAEAKKKARDDLDSD